MTLTKLVAASLRHHRVLHGLVIGGVAVAVAVLAGALLVGESVRASLRELALARLGATDVVISSTSFFRERLADEIRATSITTTAPMLAVAAAVTHEDSRRSAARVNVFGIDDRFLAFHGRQARAPRDREAWMSEALAAELGAKTGESLLLRVAKPGDIPLGTLQGRREDVSERVRLEVTRVLDRQSLGEFSLVPAQGPALTMFVPLSRLQQDLDQGARVNAVLVKIDTPSGNPQNDLSPVFAAIRSAVQLDDLGLRIRTNGTGTTSILESRTGLLPDRVARRVADSSGRPTVAALTYLANSIRARGREIPYSLITAIDLNAYDGLHDSSGRQSPTMSASPPATAAPVPPIRLNEWAAQDLGVVAGDRVEIEYYLWSDQDGLRTESAAFTFAGTVPMSGAGGDRTLTPEYRGITDASDVTSWDPPFPVDLKRVRDKDEDYWDTWHAAPKAFVPLEVGQGLWPSTFGSVSSLRSARLEPAWPSPNALDPFEAGITVRHARAEALAAANGTTDFGEYFIYFSFFLVVSGLLLAGTFFALIVEQRAAELGLLLALGFRVADIRRALLIEAAVVGIVGAIVGIAGAIGYGALIMYGLRTWWVGAVGTTALELHVDPLLLAGGAAGALIAALVALFLSFRRLTARSARALLTSGLTAGSAVVTERPAFNRVLLVSIFGAGVMIAGAVTQSINQVAGFFSAGGLLLVAGCAGFMMWLRKSGLRSAGRSVARFGAAYARWRPTRSVLSASLIAFACFVIVSVGAFRRDLASMSLAPESGTGGFTLMAESVVPLMHNPNTATGREDLSLAGYPEIERARVARFRLRPGDEASCLTLYQPTNPRLIAPEAAFLDNPRFSFAQSLAATDVERGNPWLLLNREYNDDAIPAIADQTSLTYVFHLGVGDDFVFTPQGHEPVRLRIVGTLADSVLQSELIIGEDHFVRLFPQHEGYRVWLIETPEADTAVLTTVLEDRLADFGVDVTDTRGRLAAYHQVENTYLSTFQALGALGLLLGTLGLAAVLARNVVERRRELGLLAAIGFTRRHLRTVVTAESLLLVGTGVAIGTIAALIAIAPALAERGQRAPFGSLLLLIGAVVATGLLSSFGAVRLATSVPVVQALKNE
jgi:ABC-type lipoprotein release transport system permease subunit